MLQNSSTEKIRDQFLAKNGLLSVYGQEVTAKTLYEDMYGEELVMQDMPVVILGEEEIQHIVVMPLCDAIEMAADRNDMLIGSCTFFNNWVSKASCSYVYGFIIDADNFYSGVLDTALKADWALASGKPTPKPTYIVNSGTGLHLYYLFNEPIPCYRSSVRSIDAVYRSLAQQQTDNRYALHRQVQWFGQYFRFAGGLNKYFWKNTVYRIGNKWDIDDLAKALGVNCGRIRRDNQPREKKVRQVVRKKRSCPGWHTHRRFYDMALRTCYDKTKEGNRYTSLCALATIGYKCGVPMEQIERDLMNLLPKYNRDATNLVKESEVRSAMKMYNEKAMLTRRATLENWQGWEYHPAIQRNGRKQTVHLRRARAVQVADYPDGSWRYIPPTAMEKVKSWQKEHPEGKKVECSRDTGLSRTTIDKWWTK